MKSPADPPGHSRPVRQPHLNYTPGGESANPKNPLARAAAGRYLVCNTGAARSTSSSSPATVSPSMKSRRQMA
jgi:hypothetical protein